MIDPGSCISGQAGPMDQRVGRLTRAYARLWRDCPARPRSDRRLYPAADHKRNERDLGAAVRRISDEARSFRADAGGAAVAGSVPPDRLEQLAASLRADLMPIVRRLDLPLASVYDARFIASTQAFLRAAREFDPGLAVASVHQALRNVWIMNTLQSLFGVEVEHTGAIFGYSMIYPYLDNLLDDERLDAARKIDCLLKLRDRLEGKPASAASPLEERLSVLVGRIEADYPRSRYPEVHQSLLGIYNAQVRSLLQQRARTADPAEVLEITLEKGGTSVLADGYLAAGRLTPSQEEFCFGFGACLQLTDDLQDAAEDARRGHRTLFSGPAARPRLDPLVDRLAHYLAAVLDKSLPAGDARTQALRETIDRGCRLLHLEAVGKHPRLFSRDCVRRSQAAFPVRFAYLKKLRRSLPDAFPAGQKTLGDLDPLTAAFLTLSSRALALDS